MRGWFSAAALCLLVGFSVSGAAAQGTAGQLAQVPVGPGRPVTPAEFASALADWRRPDTDRQRDPLRHPADILAFAEVRAGQRIADVGPGGGYYTRLFAVAVGEHGHVYGINRVPNPTATQPPPIRAVAAQYPNVTVIEQGYQGWTVPEPLDTVFISQIYHDFWFPALNVDRAAFNREVFAALKPGGAYIVIDHAGPEGMTMNTDPQASLHRVDQALVRREIEAAGFVYDGETQILRNPADNRSERVFDADIRGHTDQFAMRFCKPRPRVCPREFHG